ncbi:hypothetical protein H0H93_007678 [Arthromyces matolae]|nr:hypothetical protein H0H93_007678 [Arthromyces matolae]
MTVENVPSELFSLVAAHLPLHIRPPTLLSLALTSRRFSNIIIPHVLYTHVRLVGDKQAVPVLRDFIQAANRKEEGHTTTPIGHYIRHLCVQSLPAFHTESVLPAPDNDTSLSVLQRLIDCDGLPNLVLLTIDREDTGRYQSPFPTTFWTSIQQHCPNFQGMQLSSLVENSDAEGIKSGLLAALQKLKEMKTIRLEGRLEGYEAESDTEPILFDFSKFPVHLHTLDLRLGLRRSNFDFRELFYLVMPNLHVLILDSVDVGDPSLTKEFWKKHPRLTRLELWKRVGGLWFNGFERGMLPNLTVFKGKFISARIILPHISESLVSLYLLDTYNAQAPYLLRTATKGGTLPALRSLGIQRDSGNSPKAYEGHRWREDERGAVTQAPVLKAAKRFDGNYLMSIAKAAPNIEELELVGDSDDTVNSITSALSRLPKLTQLTLSATQVHRGSFFESCHNWPEFLARWYHARMIPDDRLQGYAYAPLSFDQAVYDLASGCSTLERVTFGYTFGTLLTMGGVSGRVIRGEDGEVKEVQRVAAWANGIGKEEDWY